MRAATRKAIRLCDLMHCTALARLLPFESAVSAPLVEGPRAAMVYDFGEFSFDESRLVLSRAGERLRLPRKVLEVLAVLLRRSGDVVSREELMAEVWQGAHVEAAVLTQAIFLLRKALGDHPAEPRFVATIQGRGYVFLGAVARAAEEPSPRSRVPTEDLREGGSGTWFLRWKPSRWAPSVGLVAAALLASWGFWQTRGPDASAGIRSLAVVNFTNYGSVEDAHFSAALTDAVVAALTVRSEIPIRALSANPAIRGGFESDAVLTGGYLRDGDTIRVTARLDGARRGRALWAAQRDFAAGNLLRLQDEITRWLAASLSRQLPGKLSSAPQPTAPVPAMSQAAYETYLEARLLLSQRNERGLGLALAHFQRAIDQAPSYAPAHAGLAETEILMGAYQYGSLTPRARYDRAKRAARRAVELDPRSGEGWAILGMVSLLGDLDAVEAQGHLDRAVSLAPHSARAHHWRAWVLYVRGRPDAAEQELRRARALDPLSSIIRTAQGTLSLFRGRFGEAQSRYREVLELDPAFGRARLGLGLIAEQKGDRAAAERHLQMAASQLGDPEEAWAALAHLYGRANRREDWEAVYARLGRERAHPYERALAWLGVGDERRALRALRDAIDQRRIGPWDLTGDPRLRKIRGPEFDHLLAHAGLQPGSADAGRSDRSMASGQRAAR